MANAQTSRTLTARWVFPADRPPLDRGTITIDGERIVAVEPHGTRTADVDLGDVAILPGLVNAHTHLDLSGMRGKCPPSPDFTEWLRAVIRHRRGVTPGQTEADIRMGIAESVRFGTTLVGDIAAGGASWDLLSAASLRAVVYYELLGLPHERALKALSDGRNWGYDHQASLTCRSGWSPHAPYSASEFIFLNAPHGYGQFQAAVAVHLAETQAERQLLMDHTGPFVDFLTELGVWAPGELVESWDALLRLFDGAPPATFVHANYLPPDAWMPAGSSIVYCPRTHAAFGHAPHPFREFLARGVRVALGTDSLASNPDLDLLAEARFIHRNYPDVPGETLLRMATLSGAEALGWADDTGSLAPGKSADLVVLPLPGSEPADPHERIFASEMPVKGVLWRGNWTIDPRASGIAEP